MINNIILNKIDFLLLIISVRDLVTNLKMESSEDWQDFVKRY